MIDGFEENVCDTNRNSGITTQRHTNRVVNILVENFTRIEMVRG